MRVRASSSVVAKPPPPPPSVKAGRTTIGALSISTKRSPSSTVSTTADSGTGSPMPGHQRSEPAAVLGGPDGVERRAEHAHAVAVEHAGVVERHRKVQPGLPAEGREQGVGPMLLDHPRRRRSSVSGPMITVPPDVRIGHHRGGVRVDEDGLDARLTQRQAGLDAGIVELGRLADEDRS